LTYEPCVGGENSSRTETFKKHSSHCVERSH
jgi:hypothetical protein